MSNTLITTGVEARLRNSLWAGLMSDTLVKMECDPLQGIDAIEGEIVRRSLPPLQLVKVTSCAQLLRRTAENIALSRDAYMFVSIQSTGIGQVTQDGREATLRPGDFAIYDSSRPFTLQFAGAFQQHLLRFPANTFPGWLRRSELLTAIPVPGNVGPGRLMEPVVSDLVSSIDKLSASCACALADAVTQLLVAGLCGIDASGSVKDTALRALYRRQIRETVDSHLRDPGFGVSALARRLKVSTSTLQRAWAGEGSSLHEYIWQRRLDGARRELLARGAPTVCAVAFSWGFNDAAHFSRAFRARFGQSPRDARHTPATATSDRRSNAHGTEVDASEQETCAVSSMACS